MQTLLRFYGVLAVPLVGVALSTWSPRRAVAECPRAVVAVTDLRFPEGTIFVDPELYFVDYARSDVLHLVGTKTEVIWHQDGCGANGLVAVRDGLLVACFENGTVIKISLGGATLATTRKDSLGQAFAAPNDLASDRKGGVYPSDSGSPGRPGKAFYLGGNGRFREVASGITNQTGKYVTID